eukprot:1147699-Pelagomonas_calceolata.AAC.4
MAEEEAEGGAKGGDDDDEDGDEEQQQQQQQHKPHHLPGMALPSFVPGQRPALLVRTVASSYFIHKRIRKTTACLLGARNAHLGL